MLPEAVRLLQCAAAAVPHMEQFCGDVCKVRAMCWRCPLAQRPASAHQGQRPSAVSSAARQQGKPCHGLQVVFDAPDLLPATAKEPSAVPAILQQWVSLLRQSPAQTCIRLQSLSQVGWWRRPAARRRSSPHNRLAARTHACWTL